MKKIQFGLGLLPILPAGDLVKLAVMSEDYGFDFVWLRDENPSFPFRDAFMILTLMAAKTSKIGLGTSITSPYSRHPALLAEAMLTLDEISNGRAAIGLGPGGSLVLPLMGIPMWHKPLTMIRETVQVLRSLFSGEQVDFKGEMVKVRGVKLFDKPRKNIPIYIGARGPRMLSLAGEIADGVQMYTPPKYVSYELERIEEGLKKTGRNITEFYIISTGTFCVSYDEEEARKLARYNLTWIVPDSPDEMLTRIGVSRGEADKIAEVREAEGREAAMEFVTDKMIDEIAVAGTPETCAEKFALKAKMGVNQIIFGNPFGKDRVEALKIVGEEIIPGIKKRLQS